MADVVRKQQPDALVRGQQPNALVIPNRLPEPKGIGGSRPAKKRRGGRQPGAGRPRRLGRATRAEEQARLKAVYDAMPTERWLRTLENYAKKAEETQDRWAIRFFAEYMMGKPTEYIRQDVSHAHVIELTWGDNDTKVTEPT